MKIPFLSIIFIFILGTLCQAAFIPPGQDERLKAIGSLEPLPAHQRSAFSEDGFEVISKPGPADWLASHTEVPQTFSDYLKSKYQDPDAKRKILYIQPLGDFTADQIAAFEKLSRFGKAFFQMEFKILPPEKPPASTFVSRLHPETQRKQLHTGSVLAWLKLRIPKDAYCIITVTMEDLYPEDSWNFVFGQASLRARVGVFSMARYDPAFYNQPRPEKYQNLIFLRSCKVLVHETGHMFGLTHCTYFQCIMNGSNHLEETDRRPLHLCPVCLRKLQSSINFDSFARYKELQELFVIEGMPSEAQWTGARLKALDQKPK